MLDVCLCCLSLPRLDGQRLSTACQVVHCSFGRLIPACLRNVSRGSHIAIILAELVRSDWGLLPRAEDWFEIPSMYRCLGRLVARCLGLSRCLVLLALAQQNVLLPRNLTADTIVKPLPYFLT